MKFLYLTFILIFCCYNLNAATHTVTNGNDSGAGSLRQTVLDANSGDTIIFAPNVDVVSLTSEQITINKNLTINGKSKEEKTAISGNNWTRIFRVEGSEIKFRINNLIIEKGWYSGRSGGIDIGGQNNKIIAINCSFYKNQDEGAGGAVCITEKKRIYCHQLQF